MRIKHLVAGILAILPALYAGSANAHEQAATDTIGKSHSAFVTSTGEANWFIDMNYNGFTFQIPAGTLVERGSGFTAKYPDGSFGLSMNTVDKPMNQKYSYEVCKRLAATLKIPNPDIKKVKYGRCRGAMTSGKVEGQLVTVLVLPYDDQEITTVIMATPNRNDWVNHYLETLKR